LPSTLFLKPSGAVLCAELAKNAVDVLAWQAAVAELG
jgi:hypothetical protein